MSQKTVFQKCIQRTFQLKKQEFTFYAHLYFMNFFAGFHRTRYASDMQHSIWFRYTAVGQYK